MPDTPAPDHPYTADYYLNGVASGLSNYENYQWLPDKTGPMAWQLRWLLGIKGGEVVLDYGCARGYLVRALRKMANVDAYGYDISEWAIANCDPDMKEFVSNELQTGDMIWDHVIAKDVLEHVPLDTLDKLIPKLLPSIRKQLFIIVPLTDRTDGPYLCPVDEMDSTHGLRWTLPDWLEYLQKFDKRFVVTGGYEAPVIKPNCYEFPRSYGFITVRRLLP